jgi:hypothetical protein
LRDERGRGVCDEENEVKRKRGKEEGKQKWGDGWEENGKSPD